MLVMFRVDSRDNYTQPNLSMDLAGNVSGVGPLQILDMKGRMIWFFFCFCSCFQV